MKQEELKAWQPDQFDRFVRILEQDQLNHAYLFSSFFGSLEMAQFLAKSLFCTDKVGVLPCEKCRNCKLIEQGEFPDVTLIKPVNQVIKTERIRELVGQFSQAGLESQQQVFIIEQAEKMHPNAANSLLKVIEEPQSEVYIFFLTSDEEKMLPTIRSRTQIFHFKKQEEKLIHQLEQAGLVKKKATLLAQFSQSRAEAEKLANQASFWTLVDESERLLTWLLAKKKESYLQVAKLANLADDKEKQDQVLRILEVLCGQDILQARVRVILQDLLEARKMWQANVSFQNAMEYLVLKEI
ncbi:DNA polymerase III subunit delta' [Streptococcus pseudopneumoniae]|uniref:DNA polymerase III subunit delta' n=1 Tax=Streptococcus pseudopneumoniae TaxID=257758 RepID=UPI0003D3AC56|nr:DNA polymerase III subunit delta' [Streptococcus pseudopneumoniae]ETD99639.1 DNA polymerase III subunit delta' [Streptococcus pseudopneumoniae 5247]